MKILKERLLEKIESLNEMEKYQEIIDLIETLPAEQLNTELMGELGRAYNNRRIWKRFRNIKKYRKWSRRYCTLELENRIFLFFLRRLYKGRKAFFKGIWARTR